MMNKLFFLLAGTLLLTGCAKDLDFQDLKPDTPTSIDKLNISDSFSWNTGNAVKIGIEGLPTCVPIRSTLQICLPDCTVVYSRMHLMSENLTVNLMIPANTGSLILSYGSQKEELPVNDGEISFSFIPAIVED
ncbi:MAG: hypothetical protein AB9834_18505 [Lentimicrobium sp.]